MDQDSIRPRGKSKSTPELLIFVPVRGALINFSNILQIREPLSEVESTKSEILWTIPPEVVDVIFQFLPDLDQAYFALSCTRLHAYYVSYTRRRGICVHSTLPRTELLHRLQNERWTYCSGCDNLHQSYIWRQLLEFGRKYDRKPDIFECNV